MRFRVGLTLGFAAGYYLGTRAGRERHDQINRALRTMAESPVAQTAAEKTKVAIQAGASRARSLVGRHGDGGPADTAFPPI